MKVRFSAIWFSVAFCAAYLIAFRYDLGMFRYYPLTGEFHVAHQPETAGPPIVWYGISVTAALAAVVAGFLLREHWIPDRLLRWIWVVPVATMAAIALLHGAFF